MCEHSYSWTLKRTFSRMARCSFHKIWELRIHELASKVVFAPCLLREHKSSSKKQIPENSSLVPRLRRRVRLSVKSSLRLRDTQPGKSEVIYLLDGKTEPYQERPFTCDKVDGYFTENMGKRILLK